MPSGNTTDRTVLMHVESLMFVVGLSALGWFILRVPVKRALPTCHYRARLGHFRTFWNGGGHEGLNYG